MALKGPHRGYREQLSCNTDGKTKQGQDRHMAVKFLVGTLFSSLGNSVSKGCMVPQQGS